MFGKWLRAYGTILLTLGMICGALVGGSRLMASAEAANFITWDDALSAKMSVTDQPGVLWKDWYRPFCQPTLAIVEDYNSRQEREVCYVSSSRAQLAVYRTDPQGTTYYGLKKQGDDAFHRISTLFPNPSSFVLLSDDTILGAKQVGSVDPLAMYSLENFEEHAQAMQIQNGPTAYYSVYDVVTTDAEVFTDDASNTFSVRYIAVSKNEKFATAQVLGRGLVRIDLTTRDVRLISNDYSNNSDKVVLAISNDGNKVAVTGPTSVKHRIYVGLDDCGAVNVTAIISDRSLCYFTDLSESVSSRLRDDVYYNPEFVNADTEFVVNSWKSQEEQSRKLTFTPDSDNYRLEYLAMGDSYSSGEGDIGRDQFGKNYYLINTDTEIDSCHVSSRSYPFLLRQEWRITSDRMRSIACSNAQVIPDFNGNPHNYTGQKGRLRNSSNITRSQSAALQEFIPGRITQLEFVKKYKPKIVTFTGGGNDVGFVDILTYCVSPGFIDLVPWVSGDCQYAVAGSELQKMLINTIDTQYFYNKKLIEELKAASPQTKVVMIGYPQFIHPTVNSCALNSGLLSLNERIMLNLMVSYMNSMLKRLAYDKGVTYVDVENALAGGKICEGSEFMTGIWNNLTGAAVENELFHPNALGHKKIAQVIINADIYKSDDSVPNAHSYTPSLGGMATRRIEILRGGSTTKKAGLILESGTNTVKPDSVYKISTYSGYTQLGSFPSNSDGSISQKISLENVEIGRHVLVIDGIDSDNKPIQFYQFIEIKASENDADGDGVLDNIDKCNYITEWYEENSIKNICSVEEKRELGVRQDSGPRFNIVQKDSTSQDYDFSRVSLSIDDQDFNTEEERIIENKQKNEDKNMMRGMDKRIFILTAIIISLLGSTIYGYKKTKKRT